MAMMTALQTMTIIVPMLPIPTKRTVMAMVLEMHVTLMLMETRTWMALSMPKTTVLSSPITVSVTKTAMESVTDAIIALDSKTQVRPMLMAMVAVMHV